MKEQEKRDTIICRCQDISLGEILDAIEDGITDPEELKRYLHVGMGPCQGRTCGKLVTGILSRQTGTPASEIALPTQRPPLVAVSMHELTGGADE